MKFSAPPATQISPPSARLRSWLAAAVMVMAGALTTDVFADIDTTPLWDGSNSVYNFGTPDTATYGQTFLAPESSAVSSFTFNIATTDSIVVVPHIYAFDSINNEITGSAIFTGAEFTITSTGSASTFAPITVAGDGGLPLTAGQLYVVFLTTSESVNLENTQSFWGLVPSLTVPGGQFVYNNNGSNFGALSSSSWDTYGNNDLALIISFGGGSAQASATQTGLPMANVEGQMLIGAGSTVTNDINGHLFSLRAGDGEEDANDSIAALMDEGVVVGQGDGNPDAKSPMAQKVLRSRQWEVFTTVNYGNVKLNAINNQAGVQIDAWAPSVGIERHLSRGLAVGFAATFLTSDQNYTAGLGRLHLEGPALSAYVSFARKNFWSSLLYSFGDYELDSRRNPGFGFAQAFGTTQTYTNSVQYNTGWNFRFQNNTLVTGPFAGVDYLHGTVNAYSETGGGLAALSYGRQTYQSLVARVGWSATKKIQTSWAAITPQVRLSYERQNLTNNGTSVSLINAPFTAAGGNQSPGQSYVVAGAGVNFQFNDQFSMLLSYQGQFLRQNMQAHFASVRLSYKF